MKRGGAGGEVNQGFAVSGSRRSGAQGSWLPGPRPSHSVGFWGSSWVFICRDVSSFCQLVRLQACLLWKESLHLNLSSSSFYYCFCCGILAGLFSLLRPQFSHLENEELGLDLCQGSSSPPASPLRLLRLIVPSLCGIPMPGLLGVLG